MSDAELDRLVAEVQKLSLGSRVPIRPNDALDQLIQELVPGGQASDVRVVAPPESIPQECFLNVERQVRVHGGRVQYGWSLHEVPHVLMEAEFHAVWESPGGELVCVSPNQLATPKILFLPDPVRIYEGRNVENVRRPLAKRSEIRAWIACHERSFDLMNRGERATQREVELGRSDFLEGRAITRELITTHIRLWAWVHKVQPTDRCPCNSGRKYKKCHGL
jgi:hypothetical protein